MTVDDVAAVVAAAIAGVALIVSVYSAIISKRSAESAARAAVASEASATASERSADATESSTRVALATFKAAHLPRYEVDFGVRDVETSPNWWLYIKLVEGPPDLLAKERREFIYDLEDGLEQERDEGVWSQLAPGRARHTGRFEEERGLAPLPVPITRAVLVVTLISVTSKVSPAKLEEKELETLEPWTQEVICNWRPGSTKITY